MPCEPVLEGFEQVAGEVALVHGGIAVSGDGVESFAQEGFVAAGGPMSPARRRRCGKAGLKRCPVF